MKKIKTIHQALFLGLLLATASCRNSDRSGADTQAQIFNTGYDLTDARTDIQADYEAFKMKMNEKLTENEMKLSGLKAKAASKTKEEKLQIAKKIAKLEVKNNNLRTKLTNYTKYDSATWESFKNEVENSSAALQKEIDGLHAE